MRNKFKIKLSKSKNFKELFKNLFLDFLNNIPLFLFSLIVIIALIFISMKISKNLDKNFKNSYNKQIHFEENFTDIRNLELNSYNQNQNNEYKIYSPFIKTNYDDIAYRVKTFYGENFDIDILNEMIDKKILKSVSDKDFKNYFYIDNKYLIVKVIENRTIQPKAYINYCPVNGSKQFYYDGKYIIEIKSNHKFNPLTGEGLTTNSSLMKLNVDKINDE